SAVGQRGAELVLRGVRVWNIGHENGAGDHQDDEDDAAERAPAFQLPGHGPSLSSKEEMPLPQNLRSQSAIDIRLPLWVASESPLAAHRRGWGAPSRQWNTLAGPRGGPWPVPALPRPLVHRSTSCWPPSMSKVAPVTAVLVIRWMARGARAAGAARAAGPPTRRIGRLVRSCWRRASSWALSNAADHGVSTNPAASRFTRTGASSRARVLVSAGTAAARAELRDTP